jgi:hypothetical protein
MIGGRDQNKLSISSCESFDVLNRTIDPFPSLNVARSGAGVIVVNSQYLLVFGGYDEDLVKSIERCDIKRFSICFSEF